MKKNPKKNRKGGVKKSRLKSGSRQRSGKKATKKPKFMAVKKRVKKTKKIRRKPRKIVKRKKTRRIRKIRKSKAFKPRVYVGKGLLEQLFESQPKVKVLKFFFRNHQDVFTLKQILRRLRTNVSLVRREMGKLEKLGLIKQKRVWLSIEKKRGGVKKVQKAVYCINPDFDFFNELKNLILKSTISSKDELINNVRKLGNIKILTLAGIFVGDEGAKADMLIVGDKINPRKLNTFLKDLESEVGKELNCSTMNTREFNYRYDMYDRFVRDLLSGKSEILINRLNLW